jgi:hypothetical protein
MALPPVVLNGAWWEWSGITILFFARDVYFPGLSCPTKSAGVRRGANRAQALGALSGPPDLHLTVWEQRRCRAVTVRAGALLDASAGACAPVSALGTGRSGSLNLLFSLTPGFCGRYYLGRRRHLDGLSWEMGGGQYRMQMWGGSWRRFGPRRRVVNVDETTIRRYGCPSCHIQCLGGLTLLGMVTGRQSPPCNLHTLVACRRRKTAKRHHTPSRRFTWEEDRSFPRVSMFITHLCAAWHVALPNRRPGTTTGGIQGSGSSDGTCPR